MREGVRKERRVDVLERLEADAHANGFHPTLMGGVYFLQAQLAAQIGSSLREGLSLLIALFAGIAMLAARSVRVAAAMTATLLLLAAGLLGTLGMLAIPIDIISAPATNVALGLAVDAMIHLVLAVRRYGSEALGNWSAWERACRQQSVPILTSAVVVGIGFGLFGLSTFPPTQRFGLAIAAGSAVAALLALFVMPVLACRRAA
jgi:predicted RND superfamily exporter protein